MRDRDQRGHEREPGDRRRGDRQRAAQRHRGEQRVGEDVERGERERDRQPGDEHRAAGARDRPLEEVRQRRVRLRGALLAEAGEDQKAVVDGEPEPEQRDDVDGELADRGGAREQVQHEQRPRDRHQRGEQRKRAGDQPAAEQHQHDGEDDERDRLAADRVLGGLLGEAALGQQLAAHEHLRRVDRAQLLGDPVRDGERGVLVEAGVELDHGE